MASPASLPGDFLQQEYNVTHVLSIAWQWSIPLTTWKLLAGKHEHVDVAPVYHYMLYCMTASLGPHQGNPLVLWLAPAYVPALPCTMTYIMLQCRNELSTQIQSSYLSYTQAALKPHSILGVYNIL